LSVNTSPSSFLELLTFAGLHAVAATALVLGYVWWLLLQPRDER
jgi:hypothetical protein